MASVSDEETYHEFLERELNGIFEGLSGELGDLRSRVRSMLAFQPGDRPEHAVLQF